MVGSKPAIILQGQEFENSEDYKRIGNMFIGLFIYICFCFLQRVIKILKNYI